MLRHLQTDFVRLLRSDVIIKCEGPNHKFIALAGKYTDITELMPEVLRSFITKIVIHEREQKWSTGGNQKIDIYFNHIGNVSA